MTGEDVTANVATIAALPKRLAGLVLPARARGPGRGLHAARALRGAQPTPGRGRARLVRQPPQRRGRLAPPEGPADHREPGPRVLLLPVRREGRWPAAAVRTSRRSRGSASSASRSTPLIERYDTTRRGVRLLRSDGGAAPRARLRDRRRRRQGRRPRPARGARLHEPRPPVGDRLQVPARGEDDEAARDHGQHRAHRAGHALRAARAGVRRRFDGRARDAAQRGRGRAARRAGRRHRRRAQGGRRDPRGGRPGRSPNARRGAGVEVPDEVPGVRRSRWSGSTARPTTTASTSTARPSGCSASCTSPAAARWTSRDWARNASRSSSMPACSTTRGDVYALTVEQLVPLERMAESRRERSSTRSRVRRTRPLARLLVGLGHPPRRSDGRGTRSPPSSAASTASRRPPSEELAAVEGVGPIIAESVATFFADERNRRSSTSCARRA